jgi:hypothetical protein
MNLKENDRIVLNLVIRLVAAIGALLIILAMIFDFAHAQPPAVQDTTITFTSADDLLRQVAELEGCDTITRWDIKEQTEFMADTASGAIIKYYQDRELLFSADTIRWNSWEWVVLIKSKSPTYEITCREVVWVVVTREPKVEWYSIPPDSTNTIIWRR